MSAITRDVLSRPRFNLFTSRVCRTDYTILPLILPSSLFLTLPLSLPLSRTFHENGCSYVKLRYLMLAFVFTYLVALFALPLILALLKSR